MGRRQRRPVEGPAGSYTLGRSLRHAEPVPYSRSPCVPGRRRRGRSPPAAQDPGTGTAGFAVAAGFPRAYASRVEAAPLLDGDVLGDPAYAAAEVAGGFRQNRPDEGRRASERTEVRIVYTDDTLYFGIVCYVRDPRTIIVADSRRDSSLDDTDSVQIILDTYLDQQNGFVFGTNPAGIEYDGQVTTRARAAAGWAAAEAVERAAGAASSNAGRAAASISTGTGRGRCGARLGGRLDGRVRHPVPHAALPGGERQTWGINVHAQHPPPQRALVLGAAGAPVQPEPAVAGRPAPGHRGAGPAQPEAHAVRPG